MKAARLIERLLADRNNVVTGEDLLWAVSTLKEWSRYPFSEAMSQVTTEPKFTYSLMRGLDGNTITPLCNVQNVMDLV